MQAKAFEDKVLSLSARVYPMVARMLGNYGSAEDAVQEIMMKLWDRRKQIAKHPNINGYIFLTARNHCLDLLKKKKIEVNTNETHLQLVATKDNHHDVEWAELKQLIEKILKDLPDQQREVMMLRDIDGFEFSEIADVTDLKVGHIRVLLSRARKYVRFKLKEIYHYD